MDITVFILHTHDNSNEDMSNKTNDVHIIFKIHFTI